MTKNIIVGSIIALLVIILIILVIVLKKKKYKLLKDKIEELDKEKNIIESTPIDAELSKMETIIKNEKMEEKYNSWQERFKKLKENNLSRINDMIIDLDFDDGKRKYSDTLQKLCHIEIEISKAKVLADTLLDEIKEITLSEEKYRSIIIKLKTRYRELLNSFEIHKKEYDSISEIIELQFENIEKRFNDFEVSMEHNEYNEVVHIVKAIDSMVDHMGIVISEVPDLVLLITKLIPKRIEQINSVYDEMVKKDYPLDYLQIPYNIEETTKHVNDIFDRVKVLNLEDCLFELKTMLEYLDSLFTDFENEKNSRKEFEEEAPIFERKLEKVNNVVADIYSQLDSIKNLYDLSDEDVKIIDEVNSSLLDLNRDYKTGIKDLKKRKIPYSKIVDDIKQFSNRLKKIDDDLDKALKSLGNMYEDEVRAREQLDEIQELLKQSKIKIRSYKLPIITNNYFVELSEANESIHEVIKELEKKPIVINVLNTRVDTARDLVLKLYNTTNETIRLAKMSEASIVYGNRFRSDYENVAHALNRAEILFYKGDYKHSLEVSTRAIEMVEPSFSKKIETFYKKEV